MTGVPRYLTLTSTRKGLPDQTRSVLEGIMLYDIRWHGTRFGAFTKHDALKALRLFYPGGEIIPA